MLDETASVIAKLMGSSGSLTRPSPLPAYENSSLELHRPSISDDRGPQWFGVLDYDPMKDCTGVPPPQLAPNNRYLIVLEVKDSHASGVGVVWDLVPGATFYRSGPFFDASCDESTASKLAGAEGVSAVLPIGPGADDTEYLVAGIDWLAIMDVMQRTRAYEEVIGGYKEGDELGYPIIVKRDGGWSIEIDPQTHLLTQPAAMPVVNISLGTRTLEYPSVPNDPVILALGGASRNQLIVMAAGNCGEHEGRESMSAWAELPEVLSVGATEDAEGKILAHYSSRGIHSDPESGPDLVAFGASPIDSNYHGTSFAAPKVSICALVCAGALLQLRTTYLKVTEQPVVGVPLVGLGQVDSFESEMFANPMGRRIAARALPMIGPDIDSLGSIVHEVARSGIRLIVNPDHRDVRRLVLAAARPIRGYGPHQVGAGFLNLHILLEYIADLKGDDFLSLFTTESVPEELSRRVRAWKLFDPSQVHRMAAVVLATAPYWFWDYRTKRIGCRLNVDEEPEITPYERQRGVYSRWPGQPAKGGLP